jgi:hypothetical protein
MDHIEPEHEALQKSIEAAKLEKLNLEIRDLKKRSAHREIILQLVPAITVLVTVLGLLFTIYQFHQGQQAARANEQADQRIKVQSQIRNDLDQIAQCPADKMQTVARVSFLLQDLTKLQTVSDSQRGKAGETDTSDKERRSISEVFAKMILKDINYGEPRHVDFALTILQYWDDYHTLLVSEKGQGRVQYILVKTLDALHELHKKYPDYFAQIKLNEAKTETLEPPHAHPPRALFRQFEGLKNSVHTYLALIKDSEVKRERIKEFQAAICNRTLTQQEFDLSFDPKDDPKAFEECGKYK